MIREFTPSDQQTILDFAYQREKENMFVIGSFTAYPEPFTQNVYLGCYDGDELIGIGTHFAKRFGSMAINSQSVDVINEIVDEFVSRNADIKAVPGIKKYAQPTVERLRTHGIAPKTLSEETFYTLTENCFQDYSVEHVEKANNDDIDDIVRLIRAVDGKDTQAPVTDDERKIVVIGAEWILKLDGTIISKATIHGVSKNYIQIGGVMTHPDHQGKGYAKQTLSAVCKHWFGEGKEVVLFSRNDNQPANRVYAALGFKPIDEYIIAEY